jgi:hypothetical protein
MNELARQNSDKEVHMNIRPQTNFEIPPARSFELSPLDFYVCVCGGEVLTNPTALSCHFKWRDINTFFRCVKPFAIALWPLKWCDNPWSVVPMHARFRWRVFWAFLIKCDILNRMNLTVIELVMCIAKMSAVNKIFDI